MSSRFTHFLKSGIKPHNILKIFVKSESMEISKFNIPKGVELMNVACHTLAKHTPFYSPLYFGLEGVEH